MFKKGILFVVLIIIIYSKSWAQTYSFPNRSQDYFQIQPDNTGLFCLFNVTPKKTANTTFKKVLLDQDLRPIDSVSYSIDGKGKLLATCSDERFVTHAFYSKTKSVEKIDFVITDPSGKIQTTFSKTAADFSECFTRPLKKLKNFSLSFIVNNGTSGMLIIQPIMISSSLITNGRMIAFDMSGKKLWTCAEQELMKAQTTEHLIIGVTSVSHYSIPSYQIVFIDKESGNIVKKFPFEGRGKGYRTIPVFATNGVDLMISGSEYESSNEKDGKFFMTMYNLSGEKIFDNVDTSAILSTRRLHMMGNVFDPDGNLVLIGEGWKPDATRLIASTAATVALAVLTRGSYIRTYGAGIDHKVENVVFAAISPVDGKLKYLKTYPVGPWLNYGQLLTEGTHILFQVNNQVLIYDASEPDIAPSMLTTLRVNESLTLTPTGPIVVKREKNRCVLSRIH